MYITDVNCESANGIRELSETEIWWLKTFLSANKTQVTTGDVLRLLLLLFIRI